MSTPHNSAKKGDIAEIVLMPGDPFRAKYIAENFLENATCFNEIRGMLGYTGIYKGKRISVMGHGMGIPSAALYCYELYKFYDVKKIIRIGTCGAYDKNLNLLDIILADSSYSFSNFAYEFCQSSAHISAAPKELTDLIEDVASQSGIKVNKGTVLTSDAFYFERETSRQSDLPEDVKCIAIEMEAYALFTVAKRLNKEAACILTVTDSIYTDEIVSADDRQVALDTMIKLALDTIIK